MLPTNENQVGRRCLKMAATLGASHAFENAGLVKRSAMGAELKSLLPAAIAGGVIAPSALTATLAPKGKKMKYTGIAGLGGLAGILGGAGGHIFTKKLLPKANPLIGALIGGGTLASIAALGLRGKEVDEKTVGLARHLAVKKMLAQARMNAAKNRQLLNQIVNVQQSAAEGAAKTLSAQAAIARMMNPTDSGLIRM